MVRVDGATRLHTGSFNWNNATPAGTIVSILYNDPALLKAKFPLLPNDFACNAYMTDLYTIERAYSLPDAPLPDYTDEDTRKQRTMKTYDMQWKNPRFDANFYVCGKRPPFAASEWVFLGTIPVLNTEGFKYVRHRPFDLFTHNLVRPIGEHGSIGLEIQLIDHPLTPLDKISIDLNWHQTAQLIQPDFAPVSIQTAATVTGYSDSIVVAIGTLTRQLFAARPTRNLVTVFNGSASATVYVSTVGGNPTASSNNGTVAPGRTEEFPNATGIISASASASNTSITAKETYNQ